MDLKIRPIKNNVFYIGSKDVNRKLFDQLVPLPQGTTYNSYLIKGSEKTVYVHLHGDTDFSYFFDTTEGDIFIYNGKIPNKILKIKKLCIII